MSQLAKPNVVRQLSIRSFVSEEASHKNVDSVGVHATHIDL